MKEFLFILFLFVFTACAARPVNEIVKQQKPEVLLTKHSYAKIYELLKTKMVKCYNQQNGTYHLMGEGKAEEKTIYKLNKESKTGIVYYQHKTEFEKEIIFYIQIQSRGPASTEVKLYGKGQGLRTKEELKSILKKWFKGKKAYCIGRGTF